MNILISHDETKAAEAAFEVALNRAAAVGAGLYVIHSIYGGEHLPKEEFDARKEKMNRLVRRALARGVACEASLSVQGQEPGRDIVQFARENAVEEIVIGVKKRSRVGKLVFGSTAQHVILEAHCPVLTVKESSRVSGGS